MKLVSKSPYFLTLILALGAFLQDAHAERPIRGTYTVPTSNVELAPSAVFPVRFRSDNYFANPTQIAFPLPAELTGTAQTIALQKQEDGTWAGDQVQGNCSQTRRNFTCNLAFKNLPFDPQAVDTLIQSKYLDPIEAARRRQVSTLFQGEPIGVINYELRGGHENPHTDRTN